LIKLFGKGQKKVIIFINKSDLIDPSSKEGDKKLIDSFAKIIDRWDKTRGVSVEVILGSVATGRGITGYDDMNKNIKGLLGFLLSESSTFDAKELEIKNGIE